MFHYLNARKLTLVRLIVPILLPNLICCYGRSMCNDPFIVTAFLLFIQKCTYNKLHDKCKFEYGYNSAKSIIFCIWIWEVCLHCAVIIRLGVHFHYTCCILHNVQTVKIDGQIPTSLGLLWNLMFYNIQF